MFKAGFTTQPELIDFLARDQGWAFISESIALPNPLFPKRRLDRTVLTNAVRAKWLIRVLDKRPVAVAYALPWPRIFDSSAAVEVRPPVRKRSRDYWNVPGGRYGTLEEIFVAMGRDLKSCHWRIARRLVRAKFDPEKFNGSLSDLAIASGGSYDAKNDRINLDADGLRRQAIETYRLTRDSMPEPMQIAYAKNVLALSNASDDQIQTAFATPESDCEVALRDDTANRNFVSQYLEWRFRSFDPVAVSKMKADVDFAQMPTINLTPRSGCAMLFKTRDGKSRYGI